MNMRGLVFFVAFVALSALQRMIEGAEFSAGYIQATLVVATIAAALFSILLRLTGEHR